MSVNGKVNTILTDPVSGNVYLGGAFTTVGALARAHLAAINMTSGAVSTLAFPTISGDIYGIALDGTTGLDVTGNFTLLPEKTAPTVLARIDLGTAAVTSVVPYQQTPKSLARAPKSGISGGIVLLRNGGNLLVAGDFSDYGLVTRNHIAAYDLTTGALDLSFNPAPDGDFVHSIKGSADGNSIFVGGSFATIGGVARRNLAKLSLADGVVDPTFNPYPDAYVKDMAVKADGSALYVGGDFDNIAGQPMTKLAGIDPDSGAMLSDFSFPLTNPTNDASEGGTRALALSPDNTKLMVIGNFRNIAGADRPLVAQIDVSQHPAVVTSWRTSVYDQPCARGREGWMRDVDISPDGTDRVHRQLRPHLLPGLRLGQRVPDVFGADRRAAAVDHPHRRHDRGRRLHWRRGLHRRPLPLCRHRDADAAAVPAAGARPDDGRDAQLGAQRRRLPRRQGDRVRAGRPVRRLRRRRVRRGRRTDASRSCRHPRPASRSASSPRPTGCSRPASRSPSTSGPRTPTATAPSP